MPVLTEEGEMIIIELNMVNSVDLTLELIIF